MEEDSYQNYTQDEQKSTMYLLDEQQEIKSAYRYNVFGNLLEKEEESISRLLYTGQIYDEAMGQYYLRARYYSPTVGRFLQEDVYRGDGLNLYAYCGNHPVRYYDPSGYMSICNVSDEGNVEPIQNDILGKPRTGSALKVDEVKPIYKVDPKTGKQYMAQEFPAGVQAHGFNNMVDNYAGYATKLPIPNGELYQLEGALNGVDGRFEWIVQDGNVTHRMFIQNGTVNGVPIRP